MYVCMYLCACVFVPFRYLKCNYFRHACMYVCMHVYMQVLQVPGVRPSGMHPDRKSAPVHRVHASHSESLVAEQLLDIYLPGEHCVHLEHCNLIPAYDAYVPCGQASHTPANAPAQLLRYCPAAHAVSHVVQFVRYMVPLA
jgi:hypothetical protein